MTSDEEEARLLAQYRHAAEARRDAFSTWRGTVRYAWENADIPRTVLALRLRRWSGYLAAAAIVGAILAALVMLAGCGPSAPTCASQIPGASECVRRYVPGDPAHPWGHALACLDWLASETDGRIRTLGTCAARDCAGDLGCDLCRVERAACEVTK